MGLFNFKGKTDFYAPVTGELVDLKDVSDEVFASGAMGEGYGVNPKDSTIYSPVKGQISQLFPTKHAVGLQCGKMEVLVHIGIDTVDLKGKPFETLVKVGDKVDNSTPLVKVDFDQIKQAKKDPVTLVMITNSKDVIKNFQSLVAAKTEVNHDTKVAETK
ncbi:PTS sugar transporter subunit IIA [Companilactobacillus halodurans]|uniref:PTS glucose transporter subunit IIA n=1 Tax=Companilactobacillus halodurans TaxID=2584183 RepID=A0A5P0ZXB2_9LACO|nr:PTS glucose transporter subunit IIA [Companilactobacillus halodurans]MQS75189.1 PTS glucose transporter subunit IIA [Companilactobacillus halodurans]MQS97545.1 PTS glucose transporter subunit IIA [Companilactobacillus halodurans]